MAVPTPRKGVKRKAAALASARDESPSHKRGRRSESPDRPVGVTRKGLETMQGMLHGLAKRLDSLNAAVQLLDEEIETALAGPLLHSSDEG